MNGRIKSNNNYKQTTYFGEWNALKSQGYSGDFIVAFIAEIIGYMKLFVHAPILLFFLMLSNKILITHSQTFWLDGDDHPSEECDFCREWNPPNGQYIHDAFTPNILLPSEASFTQYNGQNVLRITTTQQYGYHLAIPLPDWSHPILPTKIKIKINGAKISNAAPLFTFYSSSTQNWLTFMVQLNNDEYNWLYPKGILLKQSSIYSLFAPEDIIQTVNTLDNGRYTDRYQAALHNETSPGDWTFGHGHTSKDINYFPLEFNIISYPIEGWTRFEYTNSYIDAISTNDIQMETFVDLLGPNTTLYIAGSDEGDDFYMNYMKYTTWNVELEDELTCTDNIAGNIKIIDSDRIHWFRFDPKMNGFATIKGCTAFTDITVHDAMVTKLMIYNKTYGLIYSGGKCEDVTIPVLKSKYYYVRVKGTKSGLSSLVGGTYHLQMECFTLSPTAQPTETTLNPTEAPTMTPSVAPTAKPTETPTMTSLAPSLVPTRNPTPAPTDLPTALPTECVYYDDYDDYDYGEEMNVSEWSVVEKINDLKSYIGSMIQDEVMIEYIIQNTTKYRNFYIECDDDRDATSCFVGCYGEANCVNTTVGPDTKHTNVNKLFVICDTKRSCQAMKINIIGDDDNIDTFYVLCTSPLSCKSMDINITSNVNEISIQCMTPLSCEGMNINIDIINDENDIMMMDIACYSTSSCNNLIVNTNYVENINMSVSMYEYSDNVVIIEEDFENIQFVCNEANDAHFIKYDTNEILTDLQILELAKKSYESGQLPCSGIFIDCSLKNGEISRECGIKYKLISKSMNETEIVSSSGFFDCFWINIEDIIESSTIIIKTSFADLAQKSFVEKYKWMIGITASFCFIILSLVLIYYYRRNRLHQKETKAMKERAIELNNPMVILLAIGDYDDNPNDADLKDGYLRDLDVDIDIKNLLKLFRDKLKYKVYPQYDEYPNIHWTQDKLIHFLEKQAKILEDNVIDIHDNDNDNKFDGLILAISCHGLDNNIITSDYKTIDKNVFHRIFSSSHPKSREIPRIILYDCCDGDEDRKGIRNKTRINITDNGKNFRTQHIKLNRKYTENPALWDRYSKNPDHKLATIHAANLGFQSKMNTEDGSYMINKFVAKTLNGLQNNGKNNQFLYEIFDEIQGELGATKQLPIFTYNNDTRYVKFIINNNNNNNNNNNEKMENNVIQMTAINVISEQELRILDAAMNEVMKSISIDYDNSD